jgi:rubrerythrin
VGRLTGPELPGDLDLVGVLEASRAREKEQTLFYRALAAEAAAAGDQAAVDRLNDLHADEQHHLSRLTARLLELGHDPRDLSTVTAPGGRLADWETEARPREAEEVRWYEAAVGLDLDAATRGVLAAILDSERHHERELAGKWMSA